MLWGPTAWWVKFPLPPQSYLAFPTFTLLSPHQNMDDRSLHRDEKSVSDLSEPLPLYQPPCQERSTLFPPDIATIKAVPSLGPRTNLQTLAYLLKTASLWQMLIIVWLFLYAARSHDSASGERLADGITGKDKDRCYAAYRAACEILWVQLLAFFAVHLARCIYHAKNAHQDVTSDHRTRREEPEWFRQKANVAMAFNIFATLFYIWDTLSKAEFSGSSSCTPF